MKNKFDIGLNKFQPNQLPQLTPFNNVTSFTNGNNLLLNTPNNPVLKNNDLMEITNSMNMTNFKFNNYESERKFVMETKF